MNALTPFAAMSSRPGVLCAYDGSSIGKRYTGSPFRGYPLEMFGWAPAPSGLGPVVDADVPFWGSSSIRFDRPTKTGGNAAGYVYIRFPRQFGEGDTFCTVVGVMWNDAQCNARFPDVDGSPQGGFKLYDVGTGYQVKPSKAFLAYYDSGDPRTSTRTKIVKQTFARTDAPQVYVGEAGSSFSGPNQGVREKLNDGTSTPDWLFQNAVRTSRYKTLHAWDKRPAGFECIVPNVRSLLKETCEIGKRVGPKFDAWDVHYRLWMWRETDPAPTKLIDWQPGVPGYFPFPAGPPDADERYGSAFLFPYGTSLDPTFEHPLAQVWYSGFILADRDINLQPTAQQQPPEDSQQGEGAMPSQQDLDNALALCVQAHDAVAALAGAKTIAQQITDATADANTARAATQAKLDDLNAKIDAKQAADAASNQTLDDAQAEDR